MSTDRAALVRHRYPIVDAYDHDPGAPLLVADLELLDGELEDRRLGLERSLGAAVVVYPASHDHTAAPPGQQLCRRATAAPLSDAQLEELRVLEARLGDGRIVCAYRWPERAPAGSAGSADRR